MKSKYLEWLIHFYSKIQTNGFKSMEMIFTALKKKILYGNSLVNQIQKTDEYRNRVECQN